MPAAVMVVGMFAQGARDSFLLSETSLFPAVDKVIIRKFPPEKQAVIIHHAIYTQKRCRYNHDA